MILLLILLLVPNEAEADSGCVLKLFSLTLKNNLWYNARRENRFEFQYKIEKCGPSGDWWELNVFIHKTVPDYSWIEVVHFEENNVELVGLLKLEPHSSQEQFCTSSRVGNVTEDELQLYLQMSDNSGNKDKYFLVTYKMTSRNTMKKVEKSTFEVTGQIDQEKSYHGTKSVSSNEELELDQFIRFE